MPRIRAESNAAKKEKKGQYMSMITSYEIITLTEGDLRKTSTGSQP